MKVSRFLLVSMDELPFSWRLDGLSGSLSSVDHYHQGNIVISEGGS